MATPLRIAVALDLAEPYAQHQDVFLRVRRYAEKQPRWRYVVDECPGLNQASRADLLLDIDLVVA